MAASESNSLPIHCNQINRRGKQCCSRRSHRFLKPVNLRVENSKPVKKIKKSIRKGKRSTKTIETEEPLPEDSNRCIKHDGKKWRCRLRRFEGSLLCEKHHLHSLKRRKRKVNTVISNAIDEEDGVVRVMSLGEIWALSEEPNGVPRFYGRIDKIIPIEPVMIQITPLFFQAVLPEDVMLAAQQINLGCGLFEFTNLAVPVEYSFFSHKIQYEKEGEFYKIFPRNGEVWAVYSDFDETRNDFEYKFVEVVSDLSEEDGLCVCSLVVVQGGEGIYKRDVQDGFFKFRRFSRAFMPMFSHQIPVNRIEENGELLWKTIAPIPLSPS